MGVKQKWARMGVTGAREQVGELNEGERDVGSHNRFGVRN